MFETLSFTIVLVLAIIVPLVVSAYIFYHKPHLAKRSRRYKVVLLAIASSLALDLTSIVLLFMGWYNGYLLLVERLYVILAAIPFYYLATAYWSEERISENTAFKFFVVQIPGLVLGLLIGILLTSNDRLRDIAIALGSFTSLPGLLLLGPKYLL